MSINRAHDIPIVARKRFEAGFKRGRHTACWLWLRNKDEHGYGKAFVGGRYERAHRVAHVLYIGDIPRGLFVLHHCDTPGCVNPRHLYAGTQQDNMDDCVARGRTSKRKGILYNTNPARGEDAGLAKLKARDIVRIRALAKTTTFRVLGRKFRVTKSTIATAVYGTTWAHIPGALSPVEIRRARRVMPRAVRFRALHHEVLELLAEISRHVYGAVTEEGQARIAAVLAEARRIAPLLKGLS